VKGSIDYYEDRDGEFCVRAEDYERAYNEVYEHDFDNEYTMQFLIFYAVDNSLGFDRHTFDGIDDKEKIIRKIRALPDEERHIYALTTDHDARYLNIDEFVEDYNDEILDGGWWVMRFDY